MRSIVFLIAITFFAPFASVQAFTYDQWLGGDGTFQNPSQWNLSTVPGSTNVALLGPDFFSVGATTNTITLSSTTAPVSPTIAGLLIYNYNNGPSTINLNLSSTNTLTLTGASGAGNVTFDVTNQTTLNITGQADGTGGTIIVLSNSANVGDSFGDGTLKITAGKLDASAVTFNVGGADGSGSQGTASQSGSSIVLAGNMIVGQNGGQGNYTMTGSTTLTIGNGGSFQIGSGATGIFTQNGGTLTVGTGSSALIANGGSGSYIFTGGSADFQNGFTLGNGSTGTINQTGSSTLQAENQVVVIGANSGTGTYTMSGKSATFSAGLQLGDNFSGIGTFTQTTGTVTIGAGQNLNLASAGSAYNLNGSGILKVGGDGVTTGIIGPGTFTWGGGTLQAFGADLTIPFSSVLLTSGTLDTTTNNITVNGGLSGVGSLTIQGSNTVFLNSAATYQGGTFITGGTLRADLANLPVAGAISIGTGSTLDLTSTTTNNKYTGTIIGGGNLLTPVNHVLELTNTSGATGLNITIGNGGTLQVFSGIFGNIPASTGSMIIGQDASVATSGTVNFTGTNSYTGLTQIDQGFTVTANGFAGSVTNNGTLGFNAATPVGTAFSIGGGVGGSGVLTMNAPGTLVVRTNGVVADEYFVNSALTLSGTIAVIGSGSKTYTIVQTAAGGLKDGAPDLQVVLPGNPVLFTAQLSSVSGDDSQLMLTTTQLTLESLGLPLTGNQLAVAHTLDQVIQNPPAGSGGLFTAINSLPFSQIPNALDQLAPETLQYARNIAFENSTFLAQRMNTQMARIRAGYTDVDTSDLSIIKPGFNNSLGRSLGSLLAYYAPAPNGVNYYPQDSDTTAPYSSSTSSTVSTPSTSRDSSKEMISDSPQQTFSVAPPAPSNGHYGPQSNFTTFVSGDFIQSDLNQNTSAANAPSSKASYTAGDATAGVSFRMTSNLAAGVLFDYNHTDATTDSNNSKIKVDSYSPGLFATFFQDGFYANGLFSYGYNQYSNSRNINFGGATATARSSPTGNQYVGNLDVGYDFHPDRHWTLGPTLGATYTHLDINSFNESEAGPADLSVASQSADSLRSRLGGHVIYQARSGPILFQPNLTAMWQHEFLADSSGITSSFAIPGTTPFSIQTAAPSRDSALLGCGLTATLDNAMAVYFNYFADVGAQNYFAQSVEGGFKASF